MYSDVHRAVLAAFGEARAIYPKSIFNQGSGGKSELSAMDLIAQDAICHQVLKAALSESQIGYLLLWYARLDDVFQPLAREYISNVWPEEEAGFALWCVAHICGQPAEPITFREWAGVLDTSKSTVHRKYMAIRKHLKARRKGALDAARDALEDRGLLKGKEAA